MLSEVMHRSVFAEFAALLVVVAALGGLALVLRQPLVVAFIAAGVIAGPAALGIARSTAQIDLLSDLGISVLLFLVGLKLDLKLVRTLGGVSVATGLGQVLFTSLVGFGLCLALGLAVVPGVYVAVALTFSSTIIIVKLLSDKRELDALHGRIALGFLIVQDLVVVVAMIALSTLGVGEGSGRSGPSMLAQGVALVAVVLALGRYGAEPVSQRLARSPEALATVALAWAVLLSATTATMGFGKELGGLLAGVSLASTSARDALASRLAGLRDFLLLFFFVGLGARLELASLGAMVPAAVVLSVFVLVGNPIIVMVIMGAMGYRRRTGFLAGLTVAQISEFSLVFVAMGARLGHLPAEIIGLVTLVGLVTIALSTYLITYAHPLYARLEPLLGPFERKVAHREAAADVPVLQGVDAVVLGLGRLGRRLGEGLTRRGWMVLGVDFDPEALRAWTALGHAGLYGDGADPELLAELPRGVPCVVVALPPTHLGITGFDTRAAIVQTLRGARFEGLVAVAVRDDDDARAMRAEGADFTFNPFAAAAEGAADTLFTQLRPEQPEEPTTGTE